MNEARSAGLRLQLAQFVLQTRVPPLCSVE
jgi:hypothetical protein